MLDGQAISGLADTLQFVQGEIVGWSPPDLEGVPLETLLKANAENGPVLRQCQELLHQITRDDFVFEWDFYRRNEALFKKVPKILMALWMESLGDARQGDLNGAIVNALDSLALIRPLKDVAFLDNFLTLSRFLISPILGTFKTQRNDFSPALRKLIIGKCLALLEESLPDAELLRRSVEYLTRYHGEIVGDLKKAEKDELAKCGVGEADEIQDYYSLSVMSASSPYTPKELEKMEWGLKLIRAQLSLVLLDQGLRNYKEEHGDYPLELGQLIPDFIPRQVVDPYSQGGFVYKRINSSSYTLCSAGYFGLSEILKSGGHPLMLKVWEDLVVEE